MSRLARLLLAVLPGLLLAACAALPPQSGGPPPVPPPPATSAVAPAATAATVPPPPPAPPAHDLWSRVRAGLALPGCASDPAVPRTARGLVGDPVQFEQMLSQVRPLMALVQQAVELAGIPSDFTLLPLVESSFRPDARGPGGYMGLWQFDSTTARGAGMPILAGYDGRRDPWVASVRATRMLAGYGRMLHDWRLVVWAFNQGPWGIRRLYERLGAPPPSPAIPNWPVGAAARDYLQDLMAYDCIVRDPARFGVTLPPAVPPATLWLARLPAPIAPALAAHLAGLQASELLALNPGYLDDRMPPHAPWHLLMPLAARRRFLDRYARLSPRQWGALRPFRVREAGTLAQLLGPHGPGEREALALANGVDTAARLRAGRTLWLPASVPQGRLVRLHRRPPRSAWHIVRPGDNLWSLARRYGVSIHDLRVWNRLRGNDLRIGERLRMLSPG